MSRRKRPAGGPRRPAEGGGALYSTLDLHGETADSARRMTEAWLRRQRDEGERLVRVITGRGRHSVGAPVLREEIGHLLRGLTGGLVVRVQEESGGGAFRVELRSPAAVPPRAPPPAPKASPALRREAEEALAELGIAPTPELLDAEIRRIRAERQAGNGG